MLADALKTEARESRNAIAMCIACFLSWILELVERFLKYIIRNAYIIVAKDGTPLFESGKKAFNLIFENLMDVYALNKFGDLVLFMGRLFVVAISSMIAYYMMVS
jgi:ABC-type phosphate transport system permease subunit